MKTGYFKQISIDYPNMVTINDDNYAEITDSALMLMVIEMGGVLGQDYCPTYLSDCSTFSNGSLFGSVTASNITTFRIQIINAFVNYIVYNSEINWFKRRNNAPNADKFILKNYMLYRDLSPWIIYKKR